jgi:tRNA G37 N-methylase TrmD
MRFDVITLFPEMFGAITDEGVIADIIFNNTLIYTFITPA